MTNQRPENKLKSILITFLSRTGKLDCPRKPLMQKLEQSTLIGIETDHLRKTLTFLDYFHLYNVRTSGFLTSFQLVNLNCKRWNLSWERIDKTGRPTASSRTGRISQN